MTWWRGGLLHIRTENQGVCLWAARLEGSDDPPVFLNYGWENLDTWLEYAASFSTYIYCWLWDYSVALAKKGLVQTEIEPLAAKDLAFLRREFTELPRTSAWPGDMQYRFSRNDQCILLWSGDDQADWFLSADTEESLERLVRDVWHCGSLAKYLYSHTDIGDDVLDRVRGHRFD